MYEVEVLLWVRVVVRVDCDHLANDIVGLNIHLDVLVLEFVMV